MKRAFIDNNYNDNLIFLKEMSDNELSKFIVMVLSCQYSDISFYKKFQEFLTDNLTRFDSERAAFLNLVFGIYHEDIKSDLEFFFKRFCDKEYLIKPILAGVLRHRPNLIIDVFSRSDSNKTLKKIISFYLLARGYSHQNIEKLLGADYRDINNKIRVAFLVSGQIRGFESALESWADTFDFEGCEVDMYISTWSKSGRQCNFKKVRANNNPIWLGFLESDGNNIKSDEDLLNRIYPPDDITVTYLQNIVNKSIQCNNLYIDIENEGEFKSFSNPMKMYYKIDRCFNLSKSNDYDLYIRIRPDLYLEQGKLKLYDYESLVKDKNCMFMHYSYVYEYYGFGVDDKFAIGKYDSMSAYSSTWAVSKRLGRERFMQGHIDLANNLFNHRINVSKIPDIKISMIDINIRNL